MLEELADSDLMNVTIYNKQCNDPKNANNMGAGQLYEMMPFFGQGNTPNWTFAVPSAYIGISATLRKPENEDKLDVCCRILDLLSTQEGQEALIADTKLENSYLKNFHNTLEVPTGLE